MRCAGHLGADPIGREGRRDQIARSEKGSFFEVAKLPEMGVKPIGIRPLK